MEIEEDWIIDKNGIAKDHWIDLISDSYEDGSHWLHACAKWDGCVHLDIARNVPFSKEYGFHGQKRDESACDDYIHICDLDKFISKLQKLKEICVKHFNN